VEHVGLEQEDRERERGRDPERRREAQEAAELEPRVRRPERRDE